MKKLYLAILMALSVVTSVVGSTADQESFQLASLSWNVGDVILVGVAQRNESIDVNTPTVTGLTFTQVATVDNAQGQQGVTVFRAVAGGTSSGQITVSATGNAAPMLAQAATYSGGDGTTPVEVSATNAGPPSVDDDDMQIDITTLSANAMVVAFGSHRASDFTPPAGQDTISINNTVGSGGDIATLSVWKDDIASAGPVTLGGDNCLSSARDWCVIAVSLKEGSASQSGTLNTADADAEAIDLTGAADADLTGTLNTADADAEAIALTGHKIGTLNTADADAEAIDLTGAAEAALTGTLTTADADAEAIDIVGAKSGGLNTAEADAEAIDLTGAADAALTGTLNTVDADAEAIDLTGAATPLTGTLNTAEADAEAIQISGSVSDFELNTAEAEAIASPLTGVSQPLTGTLNTVDADAEAIDLTGVATPLTGTLNTADADAEAIDLTGAAESGLTGTLNTADADAEAIAITGQIDAGSSGTLNTADADAEAIALTGAADSALTGTLNTTDADAEAIDLTGAATPLTGTLATAEADAEAIDLTGVATPLTGTLNTAEADAEAIAIVQKLTVLGTAEASAIAGDLIWNKYPVRPAHLLQDSVWSVLGQETESGGALEGWRVIREENEGVTDKTILVQQFRVSPAANAGRVEYYDQARCVVMVFRYIGKSVDRSLAARDAELLAAQDMHAVEGIIRNNRGLATLNYPSGITAWKYKTKFQNPSNGTAAIVKAGDFAFDRKEIVVNYATYNGEPTLRF